MRNRNVGFLIVGLSVIIGIIIWIFNYSMNNILGQTCSMENCSMYAGLRTQTYLTLAVAGIIFLIGIFFIFSREHERIVVKKERKKKINLSGLDSDEKKVIKLLQEENNAVFQASLMEKLGIGKVKATRLLDKLEAKQLIERKRRGMNNIIVLK